MEVNIMQMEKQITIKFRWWNSEDETEIKTGHREVLEKSAFDRIVDMMKEGYTSGELRDNVGFLEDDPDDGVEYQGWWEIEHKTIS